MPRQKRPEKRLLNKREPKGEEMGVPILEEGAMSAKDKALLSLIRKKKLFDVPGEGKGIVK